MAAAAAHPFHYTVGDAAGVKVASRDDGGPTTSLAVVVRGGSRYETAPGLAHGLTNFALKVPTTDEGDKYERRGY
jgi:ubiquinol-cytochrome c reductase core subunit 2